MVEAAVEKQSCHPVIDTGRARIGAAVCWANYMPLSRTAMYAKGVDLWCARRRWTRRSWHARIAASAASGNVRPVVTCRLVAALGPNGRPGCSRG
ncbi:nitrilase-related carbon-nitrogen hydrolase [Streptomyces sp. NPDC055134]